MKPVRMLLLLPLLLLTGFEATLFFNSPYPWQLGGCPSVGLGACFPITHDWTHFGLDLVFYTLLGYWLSVVGIGAHYRLFRSPSSARLWKREVLKGRFKMAALGGFLMLAIPLLTLSSTGSAVSGIVCLDPSPCFTREEQLRTGWNLVMSLWGYSTLLAILVAALGVVEDKWHRIVGVALVGVAGLYVAGVEAFFSMGVYALFGLEQAVIAGVSLNLGPLLVLSGAFLAIRPPQQEARFVTRPLAR